MYCLFQIVWKVAFRVSLTCFHCHDYRLYPSFDASAFAQNLGSSMGKKKQNTSFWVHPFTMTMAGRHERPEFFGGTFLGKDVSTAARCSKITESWTKNIHASRETWPPAFCVRFKHDSWRLKSTKVQKALGRILSSQHASIFSWDPDGSILLSHSITNMFLHAKF